MTDSPFIAVLQKRPGCARLARVTEAELRSRLRRCVLALGALVGLAACSTAHVDTAPTAAAADLYASIYSYYAELCAVSELKKKPGFGAELSSGVGGHAVFYLNNVCRADSSVYPVIQLCDDDTPVADRGVGLSVNAHYKNANWIATKGRDFFFHGTLKPGERLTRAVYAQTQARAKALGILDGVEFHAEVFDDIPPGMSREDYMYDISVATDYAIGFGRDRYCAHVPLDRDRMARIVSYLNDLNAIYKDGKKDFEWDVLRNNCAHVAHNALAAAGIWDDWEMNRFFLFAALDFPVPKNEFVNLMRRTNDMPVQDLDAVYADRAARRALMQVGVLPTAPGALAEAEPAVPDNDVYDTDLSLIFYDAPVFGPYQRRFDRIFAKPRYLDLRANLDHFAALYRQTAQARQPLSSFLDRHPPATLAERDALASFYDQYYRYIDQQRRLVAAELASLPRMSADDRQAPRWGNASVRNPP